jgi:AcrR family transcriptional regulator
LVAEREGTPLVQARRAAITDCAIRGFARTGYHATPVAEIAREAGFSQAYVFRLFTDKLTLFVAAIDRCFERVCEAMADGADRAAEAAPTTILEAMGEAYAALIADRDLLMIQVHAQSASDIPEVQEAMRRGLATVVEMAHERSGADPAAVQWFMAWGQLCHLVVTAGLNSVDANWARTLSAGLDHPDAIAKS